MKSRPISQRDMTLRSPREIVTHVAFAAYVLALPVGAAGLGVGLAQQSLGAICGGAAALLVFGALHVFARRPLGFDAVLLEIKRNPFKATRQTTPSPADAPAEPSRCASGSGGL